MLFKLSLFVLASMAFLVASCPAPVDEEGQGPTSEPVADPDPQPDDGTSKGRREENYRKLELCVKADVKRIGELSGKPAAYVVQTFLPLLSSFGLPSNVNELMGLWQGVYATYSSILQSLFSLPLSIISQVAPGFGEFLSNLAKSFGGAGNPFQVLLAAFQNIMGGMKLAARDVDGGDRSKRSLDVCFNFGDPSNGLAGDVFNLVGAQVGPDGIVDQFYKGLASNNLAGFESVPKAVSGIINSPISKRADAASSDNPLVATTVQIASSVIGPIFQVLNSTTGGKLVELVKDWASKANKEVVNIQVKVSINDKPVSGPISDVTGGVVSVTANDVPLGPSDFLAFLSPFGPNPSA